MEKQRTNYYGKTRDTKRYGITTGHLFFTIANNFVSFLYNAMLELILILPVDFKWIYHEDLMRTLAHRLVKKLWEHVLELQDSEISKLIREPSRLLFDAAELGSLEFLIILIDSYPDLIWKIDHKNRSLFHIAVLNRHENIFNLIFEIGAIKDLIAAYKDENNNNILHLAANLAPLSRLQIVSGAALQMQRELLWFKVKNNSNQFIVIGFNFFLIFTSIFLPFIWFNCK